MKHLKTILCLMALSVALGPWQPLHCQTKLYNQYKHRTDMVVACAMDFPITDSIKTDITLFQPLTPDHLWPMVQEFNLGLDKEEVYNRFGKEERYTLYTYYVRKDDVKKRFGEIKTDEDFKDIAKLAYNYNMGTIVIFHDIDTKERAIIVETFLVSTLKDRKKFPTIDNANNKK